MPSIVSPLAQVHPQAQLSEGVVVDAFAVIDKDVVVGERTHIASHACIMAGTRIGSDCKIFQGAIIGTVPQDLKFQNETSIVEIGARNIIREYATIHRGTKEGGGVTRIGEDCLIMAYVHIAHDCQIGNHCILSNNTQFAGHVIMEDYAITGGVTGVLQFTRLGQHSFLSGGTLISKDIPPYAKVMYTPGNYAGINIVGLKRRGFDSDKLRRISDIYHLIYFSHLNLTQSVDAISQQCPPSEERETILHFIKHSKNGVIKKHASAAGE